MMRLIRLALALALLGSGLSPAPALAQNLMLYDVAARRTLTLERAVPLLTRADVVFIGESHDSEVDHAAQLAVIRELAARRNHLAVGLEMFPKNAQAELDDWLEGRTDEGSFAAIFEKYWQNWPLYRDIFVFARDHRVRLVGLNVPREVTAKVAREGFSALTPRELADLPVVACDVSPEYRKLLRESHFFHGHGADGGGDAGQAEREAFERFCQAQVVWDMSMAYHARQYLLDNRGALLVVLAGAVHAWKPGIPVRLARLAPSLDLITLLPGHDPETRAHASFADAEYLYYRENGG